MKDMNVKAFNTIAGINESKSAVKHVSCNCKCRFNGIKYNSEQKWNYEQCQCECKKTSKNIYMREIMYRILAYVLAGDKKLEMDQYLNYCICTKQVVENLIITCEDQMLNATNKTCSTKSLYFLLCLLLLFPIVIIVSKCITIKLTFLKV